jgi:uncharacterized membrane protein (DUF4010 family)
MQDISASLLNLIVALVAGLLIGAERERRKIEKGTPDAAGIRTFAVAALAGALATLIGGVPLLAVAVVVIAAIDGLSYWRARTQEDADITTQVALVLTVLIGGLAMHQPAEAAAVSVAAATLLAARKGVHRFVGDVLTEDEVRAALILASAAIVVLPLLPNQSMGPFDALNPYKIWRLVVLVLAIGSVGHVAVRALGPRFGLPVAGLASGFVSSSATIGAMGARSKKTPAILGGAVAGAVLSTVATVIQLAAVLSATSIATLQAMTPSLIAAGVAAGAYGAVFTLMALRQTTEETNAAGEAFSLKAALIYAALLSAVLLASAALREWFGEAGAVVAAGLAGFVDTHAAAISISAMAAAGKLTPDAAVLPILVAFTTNTLVKILLAVTGGGRAYAMRVVPGLILVAAAAWAGGFFALTGRW